MLGGGIYPIPPLSKPSPSCCSSKSSFIPFLLPPSAALRFRPEG